MDFSIIIPTLNEENALLPCLLSIQPFRNQCEVILVDGGSTDKTIDRAKPWVDKIIKSTKGRAKQMNKGASQATGKILIFLHADTLMPENALSLINPSTEIWGRFNICLEGHSFMLKIISVFMNIRSNLTGIATGDQVIFISKHLFNKVNGYPDIALMEDISLSTQLKKITLPLCLKEKVRSSGRRWEKFGITKIILLMWSIRLRYFLGESPETLATLYTRGLFWKP